MHKRSLLGAALIGALLLAGCSGTDPGAAPGTDPGTPTTGVPGAGSSSECLVGDWLVTEDELQRWATAVLPTGELELVDVRGTSRFAFTADGGYRLTPDWGFTLVIANANMQGDAQVTGAVVGGYETSGSTLTTTVTDSSTVRVAVDIAINGISVPTDSFESLLSEAFGMNPINSSPFDCAGDALTLHFDTGSDHMEMHLVRV